MSHLTQQAGGTREQVQAVLEEYARQRDHARVNAPATPAVPRPANAAPAAPAASTTGAAPRPTPVPATANLAAPKVAPSPTAPAIIQRIDVLQASIGRVEKLLESRLSVEPTPSSEPALIELTQQLARLAQDNSRLTAETAQLANRVADIETQFRRVVGAVAAIERKLVAPLPAAPATAQAAAAGTASSRQAADRVIESLSRLVNSLETKATAAGAHGD